MKTAQKKKIRNWNFNNKCSSGFGINRPSGTIKKYAGNRCSVVTAATAIFGSIVCLAFLNTSTTYGFWGDQEIRYRVFDLGTLGGYSSSAAAINEMGGITGTADVESNTAQWHAFFMDNPYADMLDLGVINSYVHSAGNDINNFNQIVGSSYWLYDGDAYLWNNDDEIMIPLTPMPEYPRNKANAINDFGIIIGESWNDRFWDEARPVMWIGNNIIDLGTLPGHIGGTATDINLWGTIIGSSWHNRLDDNRGWVLMEGMWFDIPTFGGNVSNALSINENNSVVGWTTTNNGTMRGFLWREDRMDDLATLDGQENAAIGLNNVEQIVGWSGNYVDGYRAVLWEDNGMYIKDLNDYILDTGDEPVKLTIANDINDEGQIVGAGEVEGNIRHAVMLEPVNYLWFEGPVPGIAGQLNTFEFGGCTPGAVVYLAYGFHKGATEIPECGNLTVNIASPRIIAVRADEEGFAFAGGWVPRSAEGHVVYFQAFDQEGCAISDLVTHEF